MSRRPEADSKARGLQDPRPGADRYQSVICWVTETFLPCSAQLPGLTYLERQKYKERADLQTQNSRGQAVQALSWGALEAPWKLSAFIIED